MTVNVAEDLAYSETLRIAREATFRACLRSDIRKKNPAITPSDDAWLGNLIGSLWKAREE
jgi:hypothetical protein